MDYMLLENHFRNVQLVKAQKSFEYIQSFIINMVKTHWLTFTLLCIYVICVYFIINQSSNSILGLLII